MKRTHFPPGWDAARVRKVLDHYDRQTEAEAVAEDEAALQLRDQAVMVVPKLLVPEITRLIERRRTGRRSNSRKASSPKQPARSITR